jgi:UDP-N-acetylmuramate--alanine ligase
VGRFWQIFSKVDFLDIQGRHFHLAGIGGTGLSAVAFFLLQKGGRVSGSDLSDAPILEKLEKKGCRIFPAHDAANLAPNTSCLIYSVALRPDNVEIREAQRRGIPCLKYAEAVGALLKQSQGLCVAGTHGKTTTASLTAWILHCAGKNPSFIIGAESAQLEGSARCGGEDFVLESCEYDRSFHHYHPSSAAITNIDEDHLDYYRDLSEIQESFSVFARQVKNFLLINGDDTNSACLKPLELKTLKTLGFSGNNDYRIEIPGVRRLKLFQGNKLLLEASLSLYGRHNAFNAAFAALLCLKRGCFPDVVAEALASFRGADRRFQLLLESEELVVVDDYAHHPREIDAVFQMSEEAFPALRKIAVFQPHQHSRTRFLMEDFAESLSRFDLVFLPEIFFVRDGLTAGERISSRHLVKRIRDKGGRAEYLKDLKAIDSWRKEISRKSTFLLFLGAGDIWKLARDFF